MLIVVGIMLSIAGCVEKSEPEVEMVLSNYPKLFEKDVIIVVGENATQIEMEGAQAIAENLGNLTGNVPVIKTDIEITESEKAGYNLILVGRPEANRLLRDVYETTNATKVTKEYPGEGKGMLESLRNPWSKEKLILLVTGSDELGAKAAGEMLERWQDLKKNNQIVDLKKNDTQIEDRRVVKPTETIDSNKNRIADDLENKLKNGTYRRIDSGLADLIINLNHAPSTIDEIQIENFGGNVYEKWYEIVYTMHAALPSSNITSYLSEHPDVVLIEEYTKMRSIKYPIKGGE